MLCWTDRLMCTGTCLGDWCWLTPLLPHRNDGYASPFVNSKQATIDLVLQTLWSVSLLF